MIRFPILTLVCTLVCDELAESVSCPADFAASLPSVVAHRGGDPMYPKSSLAAYTHTLTTEAADFLECDLTITKDGVLICQHEPDLSKATNAEEEDFRHLFSETNRSPEQFDPVLDFGWDASGLRESFARSDCRPRNTWYTTDYDWNGTVANLSPACRPPLLVCDEHLPIARLDDLWEMVTAHAQRREAAIASGKEEIPREIGLYLEVKHATWHQSRRDRDLTSLFLSFLSRRCGSKDGRELAVGFPLYLQSFEITDLIRFRQHVGFNNPKIKLVGLSSNIRTLFNLPYDCCTETEESKRYLTKMHPEYGYIGGSIDWREDFCVDYDYYHEGNNTNQDSVRYLRQEGSFGEMFLGVGRLVRTHENTLALPTECKTRKGKQPELEEKFLATSRIKPDQDCGPQCLDFNVGLKVIPLGLSLAESLVTQSDMEFSNARETRCSQELEKLTSLLYLTCPTERFHSTYVLDSSASTTELFDVSCYLDVLGIHLDLVRKHPSIIEEAHARCIPVHVWTVKNKEDLTAAADLGVDGMITDIAKEAGLYLSRNRKPII